MKGVRSREEIGRRNPEWQRPAAGGRRVAAAALLGSVLLHGLFLWTLPEDWLRSEATLSAQNAPLEVALIPLPQREEPLRFVEAPSDVPQNEPDASRHFAARSQQAAQEAESTAPEGEIPEIEGEVEQSQSIVEGDLTLSPFSEHTGPPGQADEEDILPQPPERARLRPRAQPDFLTRPLSGDKEDGVDVPIVEREAPEEVLERAPQVIDLNMPEEEHNAPRDDAAAGLEAIEPLPRPRLGPRAIPAPLRRSFTQASRFGRIAIDAQLSEFGEYHQRMIETISTQWRLLADNFNFVFRDTGSRVQIVFVLTREGRVKNITVSETSSSRTATLLCKDAILSRAPFGIWTDDMVAVLGESDTVTITFYYR